MNITNNDDDYLYSLLNITKDATQDEIQRAYKALSTTFHPDKLPRRRGNITQQQEEEIQELFLEIKRATDILTEPVLRLAYDYYGEEGVTLIKRIQAQHRDQKNRKDADIEDSDNEDSDDDDEDDEFNLYERVERLLASNNIIQAKYELQRFMEQNDYHKQLTEENQVHLSCDMDFPTVIDLTNVFYQGRDYLQYYQKNILRTTPPPSQGGNANIVKQRIQEEQRLVDYQINKLRDSQRARVGMTLSCTPSVHGSAMTAGQNNNNSNNRVSVQPKWSMVTGANTSLIYPGVAKIVTLAGKKEEEQKHPASAFINMVYQPLPNSQIFITSNLSNDQSQQLNVGSAHAFANRSSVRYNMTLLAKSPLDTNLIMNVKTFRHIKDLGMMSGGVQFGGNGRFLQWNAKWEATQGMFHSHKYSANVSVGMLQGNSIELSYKHRFRRYSWLEDQISIPKNFHLSTEISHLPKVTAMLTHELASLASHPTIGFGFEHDVTLGCWTWVWECTYNNSELRIPIPVLYLGRMTDPGQYYTRKIYHGIYCLLVQAMIADILRDDDDDDEHQTMKKSDDENITEVANHIIKPHAKTEDDANRQLRMMEGVAERKRILESRKANGLVILKANYWIENGEPGGRIKSMDATKQLQFWVTNGRLAVPPIPKSSWLGFHNLETQPRATSSASKWDWRIWRRRRSVRPDAKLLEPQLTIRYTYAEYVYEITAGDRQAIILPSAQASLLGHSTLVQ